jgi:hypothetical protein
MEKQITINMAEYANLSGDKLADKYFSQPRLVRRAIYDNLSPEQQKFIRPLTEARRGIKRDEMGRIIQTKQWLELRKERLEAKQEILKERMSVVKVELKEVMESLKKAK